MSSPIVVVGSLNMDLVVHLERHPTPGETLLGSDYVAYPGGKGGNQAVAAARAGSAVQMVGAVGDDGFGEQLRASLQADGIDTSHLLTLNGSSGIALITLDAAGENMIVVSPGANGRFSPAHLPAEAIAQAGLVMLQLEVPLATVAAAAAMAFEHGIPVVLNPAPIQPLPDALLRCLRCLIVNESEASLLSGRAATDPSSAQEVARTLCQRGVPLVVVTLGGAGVAWATPEETGHLAAFSVAVQDTTAAGDGFCGALAVKLLEGSLLPQGIRFATAAAALAVTRAGAQPSLARRAEIEFFLSRR